MKKNDPLILLFVLGNDMFLRCVLELHIMLHMTSTLNLPLGKIICLEPNFTFPLLLDPPGKGWYNGVSLPASNHCVPPGVSSNFTSLFHYTDIDGCDHSTPNHSTPSNNIMVQDNFCRGSISCHLFFILRLRNLLLDNHELCLFSIFLFK